RAHRRRVVKATLMRATLHLVSRRDYATFLSAVHGGEAPLLRPEAVDYGERVTPAVRAFLADGPRTRTEVFELLQGSHGLDPDHPTPWGVWFAIRTRAHVVHAPESALWDAGRRMRFVVLEEMQLPPADVPAPVRFLPKWDSLLLGHKDRRRVMSDELRKAVIAKNGDV